MSLFTDAEYAYTVAIRFTMCKNWYGTRNSFNRCIDLLEKCLEAESNQDNSEVNYVYFISKWVLENIPNIIFILCNVGWEKVDQDFNLIKKTYDILKRCCAKLNMPQMQQFYELAEACFTHSPLFFQQYSVTISFIELLASPIRPIQSEFDRDRLENIQLLVMLLQSAHNHTGFPNVSLKNYLLCEESKAKVSGYLFKLNESFNDWLLIKAKKGVNLPEFEWRSLLKYLKNKNSNEIKKLEHLQREWSIATKSMLQKEYDIKKLKKEIHLLKRKEAIQSKVSRLSSSQASPYPDFESAVNLFQRHRLIDDCLQPPLKYNTNLFGARLLQPAMQSRVISIADENLKLSQRSATLERILFLKKVGCAIMDAELSKLKEEVQRLEKKSSDLRRRRSEVSNHSSQDPLRHLELAPLLMTARVKAGNLPPTNGFFAKYAVLPNINRPTSVLPTTADMHSPECQIPITQSHVSEINTASIANPSSSTTLPSYNSDTSTVSELSFT